MSFDLDGLDGLLPPPEAPKGRPIAAPIRAAPISVSPAQAVARVAVGRPEVAPEPAPSPFEEEAPTSIREPVASPPPVVVTPPPDLAPPPASRPWLPALAVVGLLGVVVVGGAALLTRAPATPVGPAPEPPAPVPAVTPTAPPIVAEAAPTAPTPPPITAPSPASAAPTPLPITAPPTTPWTIPFTLRNTEPGALELPAWVAACPSLHIVGHTCDLGDADANLALGLARADAVRTRLVQAGVPADHLVVDSAGEARPMVPNTTSTARAQNRRVEVTCAVVR